MKTKNDLTQEKKVTIWLFSFLLTICSYNTVFASNLDPNETGIINQTQTITGTVTSVDDNMPLPGVSVVIKGTAIGVSTNFDGNYSIEVTDNNSVLVFSSIGFTNQEVRVGTKNIIDIALAPDLTSLDEVVVIGYGSKGRRDLTSAVGSIDQEEIQALAIQSVDQAIQGRVAGVSVTQNSGEPGGAFSIRIRGVGSNRANAPLYVVDGFPLDGPMGNSFNPDDIASIDILKDAAAAAIYGARGANGVVIVTTKRGAVQKTQVDASVYSGLQQAWDLPRMLNAEEYATLHQEVFAPEAGGNPPNPEWADPASLGQGTDWLDEIFRVAPITEYKLAVSSGNENVQSRVSLGYLNQQGIIISSGFERLSLRANVDYKVNDNINVGVNITPTYRIQDLVPNGEGFSQDILLSAQKMNPTLTFEENLPTDPLYYPQAQTAHPRVLANDIDGTSESLRILSNAFVDVNILKDFTYRLNIGADVQWNKFYQTVPTIINEGGGIKASFPTNRIDTNYNDQNTWLIENTLTYDKTLGEKHNVNAIVGYTTQKFTTMFLNGNGQDFLNDEVRSISAGAIRDVAGDLQTGWSITSLLGRLSYDYDDRYLLAASIRRDGSSRFAEGFRYGTFPSVSAGWRLSGENFMENVEFVSDFKFRASWGQLGNDRIAANQFLNTFQIGDVVGYTLGTGQNIVQGGRLARLGTPDLTWETSEQSNFGLDLALFKNRFSLTADYFIKTTKDLLLNQPLPATSGVSSAFVNAGTVENRGWEFALGYNDNLGDFNYSVNLNFSAIENEVLDLNQELPDGETEFPPTLLINGYLAGATTESRVGEPFGYFRGYITDGIIQNESQIPAHQPDFIPGEFIYRDINEDGVLNNDDITKIGSPFPDFEFGINLAMDYKGFDFSMFVTGVQGNEVLLPTKRVTHRGGGTVNGWAQSLERWNGEGTSNSAPAIGANYFRSFETPSDWFVEDGSYIRFKNIELGYSFQKRTLDQIGLSRLRLFVAAQNFITITDYPGFDPEIGGANPLANGIDVGRYPIARLLRLGLNITF